MCDCLQLGLSIYVNLTGSGVAVFSLPLTDSLSSAYLLVVFLYTRYSSAELVSFMNQLSARNPF